MSSPYYDFGYQRRYAYNWHGGAGGVPSSRVAAETRELSDFDLEESGLTPYALHFPAMGDACSPPTIAISDWPALRPAGPEPLDPGELGLFDLSDNEKQLALLAAAGVAAWWFLLRKPKRRRRRRPRRRTRRRR